MCAFKELSHFIIAFARLWKDLTYNAHEENKLFGIKGHYATANTARHNLHKATFNKT